MVAVAGALFKLTCFGLSAMVYPEITNGENDRATVLGVWVSGVTMIWPEPVCPATGTTLSPLAGPKVKSGIFTLT